MQRKKTLYNLDCYRIFDFMLLTNWEIQGEREKGEKVLAYGTKNYVLVCPN